MSESVQDELARRYPVKWGRRVSSKRAALELNCMECMGGNQKDAVHCENRGCLLWPHVYKKQRGVQ